MVLKAGFLSLLQDAGRFGKHDMGLTTGGPLDKSSFNWANRLCSNSSTACAIEVSIGGLTLKSQINTQIAVTGGDAGVKINDNPVQSWRTYSVKAGDIVEVGFAQQANRHYLAVAGGFQIPPMFGSCATVVREKMGGLDGKALTRGDFLPCKPHNKSDYKQWMLPETSRPVYSGSVVLRVILGYQQQSFSHKTKMRFFNSEFSISDRCDRMGFRLIGSKILANINGILSEGICYGAIQLPLDGQPIILLNDRQTIGGYPKIGSVLSLDLPKLAQRLPGTKVYFKSITIDEAQSLLRSAENRYQQTQLEPIA